jgi:hypothetical protein
MYYNTDSINEYLETIIKSILPVKISMLILLNFRYENQATQQRYTLYFGIILEIKLM